MGSLLDQLRERVTGSVFDNAWVRETGGEDGLMTPDEMVRRRDDV